MKATGIVRRIDELGRIVIPKEIRRTFAWKEGTPLELFTEDGAVVLKSYDDGESVIRDTLEAAQLSAQENGLAAEDENERKAYLDLYDAIEKAKLQFDKALREV